VSIYDDASSSTRFNRKRPILTPVSGSNIAAVLTGGSVNEHAVMVCSCPSLNNSISSFLAFKYIVADVIFLGFTRWFCRRHATQRCGRRKSQTFKIGFLGFSTWWYLYCVLQGRARVFLSDYLLLPASNTRFTAGSNAKGFVRNTEKISPHWYSLYLPTTHLLLIGAALRSDSRISSSSTASVASRAPDPPSPLIQLARLSK
jgi:hypothetical protein